MPFYNSQVFIFFSSLLVFGLFTLDLITWVMGFIRKDSDTKCETSICLYEWLIGGGIISMYLNFFRLWDLAHLYVSMGDSLGIARAHFICRMTYEIIIILFHVGTAISGIFVILEVQQSPNYNFPENDREFLLRFCIAVIVGNILYIFISIFVMYLKYLYLEIATPSPVPKSPSP